MTTLRAWLTGIFAAALILAILLSLVPKSAIRSVAKYTGGLIMLLMMLRPVLGVDLSQLRVDLDDSVFLITEQAENYQKENLQEMSTLIEQETAAYISEEAASLGLTCHAVVDTEIRDGVPFPCTATLDIPRNEHLAAYMAGVLDIPPEHQYWQEGAAW